jgi:hypothetical protein
VPDQRRCLPLLESCIGRSVPDARNWLTESVSYVRAPANRGRVAELLRCAGVLGA